MTGVFNPLMSQTSPDDRWNGYLGSPEPIDLAMIAPDARKWDADQGFAGELVQHCINGTRVVVGAGLGAVKASPPQGPKLNLAEWGFGKKGIKAKGCIVQ